MRCILKTFLFALSLSFMNAQNTVAVLDFEGIGISKDEARALSNRFGTEFMSLSSGRFTLLERQQMGDILEEQGFQQSGCVSSECAVEVGAALGAKFIIIGSISKVGTLYSVNARFLDVETSEIVTSISHDQMGDIMTLMTQGMKESALKLLGEKTSSKPMATTGSFSLIASQTGISLHDPETGEYLADAPTTSPEVAENVDPGIYKVQARKEGYHSQIFEVEIFAGQESNITITELRRKMGTFTLDIYTDSSLIFINGEFIDMAGVGLYELNPSPYGTYNIEVKREGYEPFFSVEKLSLPDKEIYVELVRTFPSVTVSVKPKGSSLFFNKQTYSDFGTKQFKVKPGPYPIKISKDGYIPLSDNVYLAYGDNKELNFSLVRAIANIQFSANTEDFQVTESGRKNPESLKNNVLENVPFGLHSYLITAPKYEPLKLDINIDDTKTIYQNLSLVKKSKSKALIQSILLPGWGQMYSDDRAKGVLMMGLHIGAGALLYSNYSKYDDSSFLKDFNYARYMEATSTKNINMYHDRYKANVEDTNNAATMVMSMGATFAINWAFSIIDVFLFSDLE